MASNNPLSIEELGQAKAAIEAAVNGDLGETLQVLVTNRSLGPAEARALIKEELRQRRRRENAKNARADPWWKKVQAMAEQLSTLERICNKLLQDSPTSLDSSARALRALRAEAVIDEMLGEQPSSSFAIRLEASSILQTARENGASKQAIDLLSKLLEAHAERPWETETSPADELREHRAKLVVASIDRDRAQSALERICAKLIGGEPDDARWFARAQQAERALEPIHACADCQFVLVNPDVVECEYDDHVISRINIEEERCPECPLVARAFSWPPDSKGSLPRVRIENAGDTSTPDADQDPTLDLRPAKPQADSGVVECENIWCGEPLGPSDIIEGIAATGERTARCGYCGEPCQGTPSPLEPEAPHDESTDPSRPRDP